MSSKLQLKRGKLISLAIALAGFLVPFFIQIPGLSEAGHRLLSVFLLFASYLLPFNLKFGRYSLAYLSGMFLVIYFLGYDGSTDFFYFQF